jgi:hypothetical protein
VGAVEALGGPVQDRFGHAFRICVHLAVPEADDGPPLRLKMAGAGFVAGRTNVLASVDLHDQPRLAAGEVGDVRLDGKLTRNFGR